MTEIHKEVNIDGAESHGQNALKGFSFFVQASTEFPASVQAQGVFIAKLCMESGTKRPEELCSALAVNGTLMNQILDVANSVHKRNGKEIDIDSVRLLNVVMGDFEVAGKAMELPMDGIDEFFDFYNDFKSRKSYEDPHENELELMKFFDRLLYREKKTSA